MPRIGMEPIRKSALVEATIAEIGRTGSLDVTVSQIARRAGMSSALAHHYFGSKDNIFLAAMRHILTLYAAEVRGAMSMADTPRASVEAIIRASFSPINFRAEVVSAWLNFYVLAQTSGDAGRLLRVYQRRLRSNLVFHLRPLAGAQAPAIAQGLAAMIDGLYIRQALRDEALDPQATEGYVIDYLDMSLRLKGGA
ncbi:MAG: transcriptional regulator BetI [Pseudomonadota bacterium]|uniref:HTH-type transcriptional regulator BetI n=1 Tax=Actibacterium naphthalenivorans TaxID=1614693 RepID=A0A840CFH3_9RHOB|nr:MULTISPECIES: transcriptional regulator BetI [Actibacterium]MBB4020947.1 TetR/AcrR family transcriptional repressor of bet genes [Actibacterium naphthalenivorans]MDY6857742.1 transcriptional regulator BetI [Pseudomonadota bacterium]